jgi:DNA-binding Lrp family transcriptional regulator
MHIRLDSTDLALIKELETEARRSNSDLGIVLGVSEKTVRRWVQRLIEEQVIRIGAIAGPLPLESKMIAV